MQRDNWTCQWCGNTDQTLHVHHFNYEKGRAPWEAEDHEMGTLCCFCHEFNHIKDIHPVIKNAVISMSVNHIQNGEAVKLLVALTLEHYKKGK